MPSPRDQAIYHNPIHMPLIDAADAVIGVEATAYLQMIIDENAEPLLAALGGYPMVLRENIEAELNKWTENSIRPLFVFDGQPVVGQDEMNMRNARSALLTTQTAWELYGDNKPTEAVRAFGSSCAVRTQELYPILQAVLRERNLDYMIAPFSACAQLAYLDTTEEAYIDGIMGSQELLLYKIDNAVIFPPTAVNWDTKEFYGVEKAALIQRLNISPPEIFVDALLMAGTSFLPQFPQANTVTGVASFSIRDAYNGLRAHNKSVIAFAAHYLDKIQESDPDWLNRYQKAKMAVDHCVTISVTGQYRVQDYENLTLDNSLYLGLQLPSELYHYLSKEMIGPRVMSSLTWLDTVVFPTLDGVQSNEYKRLATVSLPPLRETMAALIASRCARALQHHNQHMRFWFDERLRPELVHKNKQEETNRKAGTWGVSDADLKSVNGLAAATKPGKLAFAVLSLQKEDYPPKTISKFRINSLNTTPEILSNSIWSLMHLRGYVNDKHELSIWGKALAATLEAISPLVKKHDDAQHIEEAAFLAFELLQFDNLNSRNPHPELIGGPLRGSDEQKASCMLVSRTACLLKVRHKSIGYTGPLSKNFLSFYSIIKAVREVDRDLLEAITASMFLSSQANRSRTNYRELGQGLPFGTDINIGLGIAVKTYLDDALKVTPNPEERKAAKSSYGEKYLPNGINISEDLDVAFDFFDALHKGVKVLGNEIPDSDHKAWNDANVYLDARR